MVNFIVITEVVMPIFDIKISILILFLTLTYDLEPNFLVKFQLRGTSSVYIVNFIALAEETTKINFKLKMNKISELLV